MPGFNLQQSAEARWWYFNTAGLFHAVLLGAVVGPDLEPFFWLLLARPVAAVLITLLPSTTAGAYRPYLLASVLLTLGLAQLLEPQGVTFQATAMLLFLLVDVCLDALLMGTPEPEWLGRMGQLTLARATGLACGLLASSALLSNPGSARAATSGLLLLLAILFALLPEQSGRLWLLPRRTNREVATARLAASLSAVPSKEFALPLLALFAVAALSGLSGGLLFPVPVISASALSGWLSEPAVCVAALFLITTFALTLERISRPVLVLLCYPAFLLALSTWFVAPTSPAAHIAVEVSGGLALLVAYRQTLASAPPQLTAPLRSAVTLTVWALGMLAGQTLQDRSGAEALTLAIPAVLIILAALSSATTERRRTGIVTLESSRSETEQRREPGRHGDRDFNFSAAPAPPRRRPSPWRYLSRLWHSLTVSFPVSMLLIFLAALLLAGLWQASDKRKSWQQSTRGAWIALQTELFLTSLKHRIEHEMLASNRVPTDWNSFIAEAFEWDTRPMKKQDFWGTPLHIETLPRAVRIVSAGPDKKLFTRDDIERLAHKPDGVR